MKRKLKGICVLVLMALLLTACGGGSSANQGMSISPAELDTQAQNVKETVAPRAKLFQYTVDDSVGAVNVTLWRYADGKWEAEAQGESPIDPASTGGIGIQMSGKKFRVMYCDADWALNGSYAAGLGSNPLREADKYESGELYSMLQTQEISADQELLLWASISGKQETKLDYSDFRKSKCDAGVAVTATFTKQMSGDVVVA